MSNHGTALNSGQLGEFVGTGTKVLIRIADRLGTEVAGNWARNSSAMEKAMLDALMPPASYTVPTEGLSKLALVAVKIGAMGPNLNVGKVNATKGKKTRDCFTGPLYSFRDGDLDNWLPKNQTAGKAGEFSVQQLTELLQYIEIFGAVTGARQDVQSISKSLIAKDQVWNLQQIEDMIERQEKGDEVGLLTNGYVNFFPVLNSEGTVSVVHADRYAGRWYVNVRRLDDDFRWSAGRRVFVRNPIS